MAVSYKKLWHILVDREMRKKDLERIAGLSEYNIKRLTRNEHVSTEVLAKIALALNCSLDDIVEVTTDTELDR